MNITLFDFEHYKEIVCLIKFIVVLDNTGKRVYSKYYVKTSPSLMHLNEENAQREFEKRICLAVKNYNVARNEGKNNILNNLYNNIVDIFALDEFSIVTKISNEIGIFVGSLNNSNDILLQCVYDILEDVLFTLINNSLTKKKLMESYEKFVIMIDEMINEGIVMNDDRNSLQSIIELNEFTNESTSSNSTASSSASALSSSSSSNASYFGGFLSKTKKYFF